MKHRSTRPNPNQGGKVSLTEAFSACSARVANAALEAHEALVRRGVPHILVGGLAVGAHGYSYATKDVDFLVTEEAFEHHGRLVTFAPGIPIERDGVSIDYLSADEGMGMVELLEAARGSRELLVIPIEQLVYMKLKANRPKDRVAVNGLLQAGMDADLVQVWLNAHAPAIAARFARLVAQA